MGRFQGATSQVVLASAARTTDQSVDITNYGCRGIIVTLDVTALSDSPSIVLRIRHKDPASGTYETLLESAAVTTQPVRHTYVVYPGIAAAASDVTAVAGFVVGKDINIQVDHANANSITYSVGCSLVP